MTSRAGVSVLSVHYPPEPTGNAPYVGSLAEGLVSRGHDVIAHVAHPHYPEWRLRSGYGQWTSEELLGGVRVVRRRHYIPRPPRGMRRLLSELSFGFRVAMASLPRKSVVILVSPTLFSSAIAMLRLKLTPRRPDVVVWVQDIYTLGMSETGEGSGVVGRITRFVESWTLRSADRVVVIHQRFADYVVGALGVERGRVEIIRNWTHLRPSRQLERSEARRLLGWADNDIVALHSGNMGVKQGLENIVEAARMADGTTSRVRFVLLGDGGERAALEERATGIECLTFIDPLGEESFRAALAAADVLLVNEMLGVSSMAVPSKLTSYFDAGRPVIAATAVEGITAAEVAASGGGIVVPAGEPAALLDAVIELATDPVRAASMGASGREYRERVLDIEAALDSWSSLIERVVGQTSSARE